MDTIIKDIAGIGSGSSPTPDYSGIIGNADKNAQDIIENQNQGNKEIQGNADKNAQEIQDNQDANANKITDKLEETKTGIISGLIDGIKGLFIPDADYFSSLFSDLNDWFSERLGFLYLPVELFIRLCDVFMTSGSGSATLSLPAFSIMGYQVWGEESFDFGSFLRTNFPDLLSAIQFATSVLIVFGFLDLLWYKYEEVFGHDSSGSS